MLGLKSFPLVTCFPPSNALLAFPSAVEGRHERFRFDSDLPPEVVFVLCLETDDPDCPSAAFEMTVDRVKSAELPEDCCSVCASQRPEVDESGAVSTSGGLKLRLGLAAAARNLEATSKLSFVSLAFWQETPVVPLLSSELNTPTINNRHHRP